MKNQLLIILVIILSVYPCMITPLCSQDTIYLLNPSFEDMPRKGGEYSAPIRGWQDCGLSAFPGESPPDIHPTPKPAWEVSMQPFDGWTYLGLVVRYNHTYESLSQALSTPLKANTCYSFSAVLAQNKIYKSATARSTNSLENFVHPAILNIWGGNDLCSHAVLLAKTAPVDHSDWSYYDFVFEPDVDIKFITIEAYYGNEGLKPYNGHIMVDALSPIIKMNCE